MAERRRRSLPSVAKGDPSVIKSLEKNVTQPLIQCRAIKEYWEQIKDAGSKLRRGLIRDVQEFELVLISRKKVITSESEESSEITER